MKTIVFLLVCYLMEVVCAQVFHEVGSSKLLPIWANHYLFRKCSMQNLITFIRTERLPLNESLAQLVVSYSNKVNSWSSCKLVYQNAIL